MDLEGVEGRYDYQRFCSKCLKVTSIPSKMTSKLEYLKRYMSGEADDEKTKKKKKSKKKNKVKELGG